MHHQCMFLSVMNLASSFFVPVHELISPFSDDMQNADIFGK